jgi:hypothetical protein
VVYVVQGNGGGATVEACRRKNAIVEVADQPAMFPEQGFKNTGNILVQFRRKSSQRTYIQEQSFQIQAVGLVKDKARTGLKPDNPNYSQTFFQLPDEPFPLFRVNEVSWDLSRSWN